MPVNWSKYPPYWKQFSRWVIHERAGGRCECTGQCGHHGGTYRPRRCTEAHQRPANWFKGTARLATAHLCNCDPPCTKPHHVIAACQKCHLRIDRKHHQATMRRRGTAFKPPWLKFRTPSPPDPLNPHGR